MLTELSRLPSPSFLNALTLTADSTPPPGVLPTTVGVHPARDTSWASSLSVSLARSSFGGAAGLISIAGSVSDGSSAAGGAAEPLAAGGALGLESQASERSAA